MQLASVWQEQSFWPPLVPDGVALWCQSIAALAAHTDFFYSLLHTTEVARAERFVFAVDKQRYIIGRGFLRCLLSHYLQLPAHQVYFVYNPQGKPATAHSENVQFNVSHAADLLLMGLSYQPIGVDVEFGQKNIDYQDLAKNFFTTHESSQLAELSPAEKQALFYRIWTRKEAVLKALGQGLSYPLNQFDVLCADNCCLPLDNNNLTRFFIQSVPIAASYYGAVASKVDIGKTQVNYFSFTGNIRRNTLSL